MAPTPSSKSNQGQSTHLKTPTSKHRLHFNSAKIAHPSPNPNSVVKETPPGEHPVEVVGRIRDHPEKKEKPISVLQVNPDRKSLRVRADFGYRDFSFDGVSLSEEEDLDLFYKKFVESRINGVKLGATCTIMMYGPTGSGKSHTMFGCSKQPGIVYRSLKDILSGGCEENGDNSDGVGMFVQVTVLEIYNEEIYDLLSSNGGGGFGLGWTKGGSASKVRLEVMGKKAKNATFISGTEAGKISKEIQKVEKRRIVKSTLCNERSSRSHCMIILDVPTVGGRLMLVDMAGSENIEQAGQIGFEAKMQTGKINQGNIALKRVVESIANGDSHVPFRDSKLTMLLQDSFEDDNSKILMILCASPDPKEIHKTISTLEYGAKAKCIVRGPHTPIKDKNGAEDCASAVLLGSRIAAMDQFIIKLQMEKKLKERECNEARKEIEKKDEEVATLRAKLEVIEVKGSGASEEEINLKVNEQTQILKRELENKVAECQRMANEIVEMERRRMEEKILQHEQEVKMLRRRLEEIESELCRSRDGNGDANGPRDMVGSSFAKRLMGMYADDDMVKSMDLDLDIEQETNNVQSFLKFPQLKALTDVADYNDVLTTKHGDRVCLSTVFEEEEVEEGECKGHFEDEEVDKEIIDEKRVCSSEMGSYGINCNAGSFAPQSFEPTQILPTNIGKEESQIVSGFVSDPENTKDSASSRRLRIQNIFTLCGNHRELTQHIATPIPAEKRLENIDSHSSPIFTNGEKASVKVLNPETTQVQRSIPDVEFGIIEAKNPAPSAESFASAKLANELNLVEVQLNKNRVSDDIASKENTNPSNTYPDGQIEVYVKWEALKENPGKFITTLKVVKDASLADLRKLIEIYLGADNQGFTFLVLGDPKGAPVPKEKEASVQAIKLPICNNQSRGYLACLRTVKGNPCSNNLPLSPLENKLPLTPMPLSTQLRDGFSPKVAQHFNSTPFTTVPRH